MIVENEKTEDGRSGRILSVMRASFPICSCVASGNPTVFASTQY